jgi:hypothetical protein
VCNLKLLSKEGGCLIELCLKLPLTTSERSVELDWMAAAGSTCHRNRWAAGLTCHPIGAHKSRHLTAPISSCPSPRLFLPAHEANPFSSRSLSPPSLPPSVQPSHQSPLAEMGRKFFVGGNWKCVISYPLAPPPA